MNPQGLSSWRTPHTPETRHSYQKVILPWITKEDRIASAEFIATITEKGEGYTATVNDGIMTIEFTGAR